MDRQTTRKLSSIRAMVIAETEQQRQAFSDSILQFGFQLVGCMAPDEINEQNLPIEADLWLVDSDYDDQLYAKLDRLIDRSNTTNRLSANVKLDTGITKKPLMLIGFEQAPKIDEINLYAKWHRKLKRKLANMLDLPELIKNNVQGVKYKPWQYMALLIVECHQLLAVQSFLDHLSSDAPVALLLAVLDSDGDGDGDGQQYQHHIHSLPRLITQNNGWRCQVITLALNMQAGNCYIVPPEQQVICDSTGRVILTQYDTDIDADLISQPAKVKQLLKNCSDAFGEQLLSILFTETQSHNFNLQAIKQNQSQVWQYLNDSEGTLVADSAQSELFNYKGSAIKLAEHLTTYIKDNVS